MGWKVKERWREVVKVETSPGRISFGYDFTIKGERLRKADFKTRRLVEAEVGRIKAEVSFGRFVFPSQEEKAPTVAGAFSEWQNYLKIKGVSESRLVVAERVTRQVLRVIDGKRKVTTVEVKDLIAYQAMRRKDTKKKDGTGSIHPHTINEETSAIRACFRYIKKIYPKLGWEIPQAERLTRTHDTKERIFTDAEIEALVKELHQPGPRRTSANRRKMAADIVIVSWKTAMRFGEVLALRWIDVIMPEDNQPGTILIRQTDTHQTKTRKERAIPMPKAVAEILERRSKSTTSDLIFPCQNRMDGSQSALRKVISAAAERAGINWSREDSDGVVFHTLRHTAITKLVRSGVPLPTVGKWAGHSTKYMTMLYSHWTQEDMIKALQIMDE
jgi:integrase